MKSRAGFQCSPHKVEFKGLYIFGVPEVQDVPWPLSTAVLGWWGKMVQKGGWGAEGLGGTWDPVAILKKERKMGMRGLDKLSLQNRLAASVISFYMIQLKFDTIVLLEVSRIVGYQVPTEFSLISTSLLLPWAEYFSYWIWSLRTKRWCSQEAGRGRGGDLGRVVTERWRSCIPEKRH